MSKQRYFFSIAVISVITLGLSSCGGKKESVSDIEKIVSSTCSDLRNATSSSGAAQTLDYSIQLAEAVGVSSTNLGSLLAASCNDALQAARNLP